LQQIKHNRTTAAILGGIFNIVGSATDEGAEKNLIKVSLISVI